ncbi:MAG: MFS transporter [Hyphomonadaceae bacterium]|nr:MAG: MFS transporter UMF1 family [Caulobacteraceae bacterium]MBT9444682.1 MFS transporter [Hyphomonadaceae bacterium]
MTDVTAPGSVGGAADAAVREKMSLGAVSWALYEWGRNPYVIICTIYVFAPYLAAQVIGDPVEGQAQIAGLNKWAGLAIACFAPFVGAAADRAGRRKIPLGIVTAFMAVCIALLWFVQPGGGGIFPEWIWFPLLLVIGMAFPLTEALHNAMLSGATSPRLLPHVSGLGLALGNAASVLILIFTLVFLAFPGAVDWSWIPKEPAFGLDPATFEPQRFVAIMCAVWLVVFSAPMMLYTADTTRGMGWIQAAREGVGGVAATLKTIMRDRPDIVRFLAARMLYADGKTAILISGGVYAAGMMHWGFIEMVIYGISLSIIAVLGGFVGGWLDDLVGPKRAIQIEIGVTAITLASMASFQHDTIFWVIKPDMTPVWSFPYFQTIPELAYLAVVSVIAVSITAAYASSRTFMTRLAPKDMIGELFGIYALAGTATVWMGPLLVDVLTRWGQKNAPDWALQLGFGSIVVLLIGGFAILWGVKEQPAD